MKKETIEEAAANYGWRIKKNTFSDAVKANELAESAQQDFIAGAKWQAERMYSEDEVLALVNKRDTHTVSNLTTLGGKWLIVEEWFEQFKKK